MLPLCCRPFKVKKSNLCRIGPNKDGGYVIHKGSLLKTKYIITLGLNDDWSFESHFLEINKKCKVIAYDHTVTLVFWLKRFLKDLLRFFLLKKIKINQILDIFKYLKYLFFFRNNIHYQLAVGSKKKSVNLEKILNNFQEKNSIFLKVDIEGSEYEIIKEIKKYSKVINSIVIEFHELNKKKNFNDMINFIKDDHPFKIVHIHGNNFSEIDKYGNPVCLELTLVNSDCINLGKTRSIDTYPLKGLDFPNLKRRRDIKINFDRK